MLEGLLIELGTEMALRVFDAKAAALGTKGTIADRLVSSGIGILDARRAQRQFERMAELLAARLGSQMLAETGPIPENEVTAAVLAVRDGFRATQITSSILIAGDLDSSHLEASVEAASSALVANASLAPAAEALRGKLVRECADYVIEIASSLPEFQSLMLRELLKRDSMIIERVERVLENRLLEKLASPANADEEYELRYQRQLARKLDHLQLFGLTLAEDVQRYRLTVAYIGLSMRDDTDDAPEDPVDAVVARSPRLAIRGEAGSGKTTLLQWLAVNAARGTFDDACHELNELVPFFVQLRHYVNQELPAADGFMNKIVSTIAPERPIGWADRILSRGRGLVLVDGLDELPEDQRPRVAEWLDDLAGEYPDSRFIVTSRPAAMSTAWLGAVKFDSYELVPMSVTNVKSFIDHWHEAAADGITDTEELAKLQVYSTRLASIVSTDAPIRALASTPLLCAMLCALNRDRRTKLPADRMELYRISLETLLDRRDIERQVDPTGLHLTLSQKLSFLRDIAYWMLLNSASYIPRNEMKVRIALRLESMPHLDAKPDDVLAYLLHRSGVLREPVIGNLDFIHRTFQEYLGAHEAILQNHTGLLIDRATHDLWREVIVLACGHASPPQRTTLIEGLLNRGDEDGEVRHVTHLLAVACLETALELEPALVARIRSALFGLVPPASMTEARALASAGELALNALAVSTELRALEAAACVRTLSLIGTDGALVAISERASDSRKTVRKEILRAWQEFDAVEYARRVISQLSGLQDAIWLSDIEQVNATRELPFITEVSVTPPRSLANLDDLRDNGKVVSISLIGNRRVSDISSIRTLPALRNLDLEGCVALQDLAPIADTQVAFLDLSGSMVEDLTCLPRVGSLRQLRLLWMRRLAALSGLEQQVGLRELAIGGANRVTDWSAISALTALEQLSVRDSSFADLAMLPDGGGLRHLSVSSRAFNIDAIARHPHLEHLMLDVDENPTSAERLISGLSDLRRLHITNSISVAPRFVPSATREVTFVNGQIESLDGLPDGVEVVDVVNCFNLMDISRLGELGQLRRLRIVGAPLVDLEQVVALDPRISVSIEAQMVGDRDIRLRRGIHVFGSHRRSLRVAG